MTKPGFVDIYPASRIPRSIQHNFKAVSRSRPMGIEEQSSPMNTTRQKGLRILADSGTLSSALRWVSDEEVRRQVFIAGNSEPRENIAVLDELIDARDEFAKFFFPFGRLWVANHMLNLLSVLTWPHLQMWLWHF